MRHFELLLRAAVGEVLNRTDLVREVSETAALEREAVAAAKVAETTEQRRAARDEAVVYYVERDGFVKIGYSTNLDKRLRYLGRGGVQAPAGMTIGPVKLLATHGGGVKAEAAIHRKFAASRVVGEWFRKTPELVAHIERIAALRASA